MESRINPVRRSVMLALGLRWRLFGQRDMANKLRAKFIDQIRLHELVVIGNVKTDNFLAAERFGKFPSQTIHVRLLHAKDQVGPSDMSFGDNDARVRLRSNRTDLIMG